MAITIIIACHSRNSRHVQNPVKYLLQRILFRSMCNPGIFKTLAYSESKKKKPSTLAPRPPYARYTRQFATHANTPRTLDVTNAGTHPHHSLCHATHASTPPTLACHPRKHATHATHASTNSTPFLKLQLMGYCAP